MQKREPFQILLQSVSNIHFWYKSFILFVLQSQLHAKIIIQVADYKTAFYIKKKVWLAKGCNKLRQRIFCVLNKKQILVIPVATEQIIDICGFINALNSFTFCMECYEDRREEKINSNLNFKLCRCVTN